MSRDSHTVFSTQAHGFVVYPFGQVAWLRVPRSADSWVTKLIAIEIAEPKSLALDRCTSARKPILEKVELVSLIHMCCAMHPCLKFLHILLDCARLSHP